MKYFLNFFILMSIVLLTSCNKEDKEPEYIPLAIHRQFDTETMRVKLSCLKDFTDYKDEILIVNSLDGLPQDKYFEIEDFRRANINFSEHSLIIVYQLIIGDVVSYKYGWGVNNRDERYEFHASYDFVKDSEYVDGEIENFTFIRSAILVERIPSNSNRIISFSVSAK